MAHFQPLAWELPYAMGEALKSKKAKKKIKHVPVFLGRLHFNGVVKLYKRFRSDAKPPSGEISLLVGKESQALVTSDGAWLWGRSPPDSFADVPLTHSSGQWACVGHAGEEAPPSSQQGS